MFLCVSCKNQINHRQPGENNPHGDFASRVKNIFPKKFSQCVQVFCRRGVLKLIWEQKADVRFFSDELKRRTSAFNFGLKILAFREPFFNSRV
jgi:hypothetical protein